MWNILGLAVGVAGLGLSYYQQQQQQDAQLAAIKAANRAAAVRSAQSAPLKNEVIIALAVAGAIFLSVTLIAKA